MRRTARIAVLVFSLLLPALLAAAPKAPPRKIPLTRAQSAQSQRVFPKPAAVTETRSSEATPLLGTATLPSAVGAMGTARSLFTATLLQNGKVLAVGGANGIQLLSSCEIYDPVTETWSPAASLSGPRMKHTATLLKSGKVLVAGGDDGGALFLKTSEIFDPRTGAWSATGNDLSEARVMHTATLLPNGSVLVTGGYGDGGLLSSSEIFDPGLNTWIPATAMTVGRAGHTATLLGGTNPRVLVMGGEGESGPYLSSAESYDPNLDEWTPAASLVGGEGRANHTATLLPGGKVLVAGGYQWCTNPDDCTESSYLNTAQVYDPADDSWATVEDMADARKNHTATLLPNGTVLVAGGDDGSGDALRSAALFDAESGAWTGEVLDAARFNHVAVLLPSGGVLLVGGEMAAGPLSSASLYAPAPGSYSGGQPELATVTTSVCLGETQVIATGTNFQGSSECSGGNGGQNSSTNYPLLQITDSATNVTYLPVDPDVGWTATGFQSVVVEGAIAQGSAEARIVTNGITSEPRSITINAPPQIDEDTPADSPSICSGATATLIASATGTGLHYQWYQGTASDTTNAVGTDSSSLTTEALSSSTSYWVRVTGTCSPGADSRTAMVTVSEPASITGGSPANPAAICTGATATLTVSATGEGLSYQWYQGTAPDATNPVGTGSSSYTTATLTSTTAYWVRVTGTCGSPANSRTATVIVIPIPTPTISGASGNTCPSTTVDLSTESGMADYQWYQDAGLIVGATVANYTATESGTYTVSYSNGCGTGTSAGYAVTITACLPPLETAPGDTFANAQSWTGKTTITWPVNSGATSGYRLYRGVGADLANLLNTSTDSCTRATTPDAPSNTVAGIAEDPSGVAGRFYWYLVTGLNWAEGTAGNATAGERIVNSPGDCP